MQYICIYIIYIYNIYIYIYIYVYIYITVEIYIHNIEIYRWLDKQIEKYMNFHEFFIDAI